MDDSELHTIADLLVALRLVAHGRQLAELVDLKCPESREKSLALTKIEEAVMWANAAIARRE